VTHHREEAERLCDRVALNDHGRIIAFDTPGGSVEQATGGQQADSRRQNLSTTGCSQPLLVLIGYPGMPGHLSARFFQWE
jgi:ABC-type multidrug transport system ATPase subunit